MLDELNLIHSVAQSLRDAGLVASRMFERTESEVVEINTARVATTVYSTQGLPPPHLRTGQDADPEFPGRLAEGHRLL